MKKFIMAIILIIVGLYYSYPRYLRSVEGNKLVDKNSKYYINDLYASSGTRYQTLSDKEKKMYDYMVENSNKHINILTFKMNDFDCKNYNECFDLMEKAHYSILFDHPELLNYSSFSVHYIEEKDEFDATIQNAVAFKILDRLNERYIERIIDDIKSDTKNMSDKEKIIYVYDFIGETAEYDYSFKLTSKNQSAYNVFINNNAVCAGFAKASQLIFQNIGIESYIAFSDNHMWNVIKYNDAYYYFDSTVAACNHKDGNSYYNGLRQSYTNSYSLLFPDWYPEIETGNMFEI